MWLRLWVLFLILYIAFQWLHREWFTGSSSHAVYSTQRLNDDAWLRRLTQKKGMARSIPLNAWEMIRTELKDKQMLPEAYWKDFASASILLDPLDDAYIGGKGIDHTDVPEGYFVVLGDPRRMLGLDCTIDFFGKRIGWVDISDYYLLQAFANGYRIPPSSLELVQLSLQDIPNVPKKLQKGELDYVVTYIVPKSDYHALWRQQPLALYGFQNLNYDRIRLYYPYVQEKVINLQTTFTSQDRGQVLMVNLNRPQDPVLVMKRRFWQLTGTEDPLARPTLESFVSEFQEDPEGANPAYRCYGDTRIERKAECNSAYDVIGLRKRFFTTWDRPCVANEDCPYYLANKNYPNLRGGCLRGGVCEMPIGTQRVAYQKLSQGDLFQPFCYGCDNRADPLCCQKQAKENKADYAFPNDTEERKQAGLVTILSMA